MARKRYQEGGLAALEEEEIGVDVDPTTSPFNILRLAIPRDVLEQKAYRVVVEVGALRVRRGRRKRSSQRRNGVSGDARSHAGTRVSPFVSALSAPPP
jgi:hypothetical protein